MAGLPRPSRNDIRNQLRAVLQEDDESDSELSNPPSPAGPPPVPQDEDEERQIPEENEEQPPARSGDPYRQGTTVYENAEFRLKVKSVRHARRTRYMLSDHLYSMWVEQKRRVAPFLADMEEALEPGLIEVLNRLKSVYVARHHYQIYVTIISNSIQSGLNSGNYSLNTPSNKIARWMLGMLYNFLKSNQTLKLDHSFKIQIKVLSLHHTHNLEQNNPRFRRHIYH